MHENHRLKMPATLFSQKGSRQDFLRNTAVTALGGTPHAESNSGMFGMVTGLIVK